MSAEQINHNSDIQKLLDEGYGVTLENGCIVVCDVPYLDSSLSVVEDGILVDAYPNSDHTFHFSSTPHKTDGKTLHVANAVNGWNGFDVSVRLSFKRKKDDGSDEPYIDYYDKVTHYINVISAHALSKKPDLVIQKHRPRDTSIQTDTPLMYEDANSSRAGVNHVSSKLRGKKIAIMGVGGTGSYVLDLVSKTLVDEIHIFDADTFHTHNAFRSPGASGIDDLNASIKKVSYFSTIYSKMHKRIIPHEYSVTDTVVRDEMGSFDFVFICIDGGDSKQDIINKLVEIGVPFIDCGIGVSEVDSAITGITRITTVTFVKNDHLTTRIPFSGNADEVYQSNIQIAELNALTASLAVIKWKRLCGFYHDLDTEHHATYIIDTNTLTNDEKTNT